MENKVDEISVFFPAFNEEGNIKKVVLAACNFLPRVSKKYEVIVVNDGSKDKTKEIVEGLAKRDKHIKLVNHKRNLGYGEALKSGLGSALFDLVAFTDGDGQFDIKELVKFLRLIDKNDMVIGFRTKRVDSAKRGLIAYLLKLWVLILFGFSFSDIDCGFKLFSRQALLKIGKLETGGAMISTEILAKAKKAGLSIAQVGVCHYPRLAGAQTGANLKVILRAVGETFKLRLALIRG